MNNKYNINNEEIEMKTKNETFEIEKIILHIYHFWS